MDTILDANKTKQGRAEALALAESVDVIHVAKGKKCVTLNLSTNRPDDDSLANLMLGPTGNLRAPTIKQGRTLYVGFNEDAYAALVGK